MDEFRSPITGQRIAWGQREATLEARRRPTAAEATLWRALRGEKLHGLHFRRQQVIEGYRVDFYCHRARLVVEVDGPIHDDQREYDDARDRFLTSYGVTVIRFTNDEVQGHLRSVLAKIAELAATCPTALSDTSLDVETVEKRSV
jgi:very-short-patch-repair endonuclease